MIALMKLKTKQITCSAFDPQLKSIPVEINPSIIINPLPITLSKEQLMRYTSKSDHTCVLLIEVSYVEQPNRDSQGKQIMVEHRIVGNFPNKSIYCNWMARSPSI